MEKIQLMVLGLSASPASGNAYALILKEISGSRRLPIIIGAFEAQSIALEMEGVVPPRPMTHDLMKTMIEALGTQLSEVVINELHDGTFFAKLYFDDLGIEVDSRPSDAIALAVRCNSPIFVNSDILEETGMLPQGDDMLRDEDEPAFMRDKSPQAVRPKNRIEQLQSQLDKAITDENYEKAAQIRDEIKKTLESA